MLANLCFGCFGRSGALQSANLPLRGLHRRLHRHQGRGAALCFALQEFLSRRLSRICSQPFLRGLTPPRREMRPLRAHRRRRDHGPADRRASSCFLSAFKRETLAHFLFWMTWAFSSTCANLPLPGLRRRLHRRQGCGAAFCFVL